MTTVKVLPGDEPGRTFSVIVSENDGSQTSHEVRITDADWERFGGAYRTREHLVEASFRFLLEREPKESILRSFELGVIARYFPEYPDMIAADRPG